MADPQETTTPSDEESLVGGDLMLARASSPKELLAYRLADRKSQSPSMKLSDVSDLRGPDPGLNRMAKNERVAHPFCF